MNALEQIKKEISKESKTWVVTGGAGFIGSHLVLSLLEAGQEVRVLDNFSTGSKETANMLKAAASGSRQCSIVEGCISNGETVASVLQGADVVLHQAALGSVPRSMNDPISSHQSNVDGFLQVLNQCRLYKIPLVYASSSSVYGNDSHDIKREDKTGEVLSPYAATKAINELYAGTFERAYGYASIGLRYFNVFGPRQNPEGPYAAVIPAWIEALLSGQQAFINGDGKTSRDFCFIDNVVLANFLAARCLLQGASAGVYNVSAGGNTSLNELYEAILQALLNQGCRIQHQEAVYRDFRPGDIRHSCASVERATADLAYEVLYTIETGLEKTVPWYINRQRSAD